MVEWHHQLNGHEFEQVLGDRQEQGSLASCSPWGSQKVRHALATEQEQGKKNFFSLIQNNSTLSAQDLKK